MKITLRPYKIEDTQAILDIINFNILHSTALYDYTYIIWATKKNILEEKSKGFPVFVAELDGIAVGFGMYSEFRFRAYKFTVEHSVYVNENHHEKGLENCFYKNSFSLLRIKSYTLWLP
jgi:phosphinothricin acetyltransferase